MLNKNSSIFMLMGRKTRNQFIALNINGIPTQDKTAMESEIVTFYEWSLYIKDHPRMAWFSNWQAKSLSSGRACWLETTFSLDEIKEVFSLSANKAPSRDGFRLAFFQECWKIIKEALAAAFRNFTQMKK